MGESDSYDDMDYGLAASHDLFRIAEDDDRHSEDAEIVPGPSTSIDEVVDDDLDPLPMDPKAIISMLIDSCKELGVQHEQEMTNTVLASSSVYEINEDSLRWFVLGITYSNNKRIIPSIEDLIKDMKAEIKTLQIATSSLKTSSMDITQKMVSVKDDVIDGFDKLRANVLDTVMETAKIRIAAGKEKAASPDDPKGSTSRKIEEKKEQGIKIRERPEEKTSAPTKVMDQTPSSSSSVSLLKEKIKMLVAEKGDLKKLSRLDENDVDALITDAEFAEIKYGDEKAIINEIKDDILIRLATADLLKY
ncbi:TPA_asm: P [Asclepias syriaca virus 1]|uniref:P n=1 Tax=Asclepias syriaca virus 1 TaxID=2793722 RepID=A0A8D9PGQ5_9RHAB|nr:P [Asclepias syriaca virus 1] [Asclepias syriaca virus 1]DAF42285.1 TPA_asm: P [Asclepias syriaca virus 1]